MSMTRKTLRFLAMPVLAVAICALLGGCGKTEVGNTPTDPAATTAPDGATSSYTVSVKTAGGMAMENISVSVFGDEAMTDLKGYAMTDASGNVSMDLPASETPYKIVISGAPKGYDVQASYSFSGNSASIVLSSSLVKGESLSGAQLKLGDVMYDFTVNTPDKQQVTLSELLETKKMVLLNFWYTTCSWCVKEFPYMEQAYQEFKDDVAIVALDPMDDSEDEIKNFAAANGLELTFPMAKCPTNWANTFNIQGYPTSVVIDRYGVIVLVESGAIIGLQPFTSLFETLAADNYQQKLYKEVSEVVKKVKPTQEMPSAEVIESIMGTADMEVTFRPEDGEDAEYSWPFIEAEKNGFACLKASNSGYDDSFAIMYADVTLKAGEALGMDFFRSSELNGDVFHIIVDGEPVYSISGTLTDEKWETCYPLVAEKDGTYEVAICYIKDESDTAGDDTFYIKNMRIVSPEEIDAPTYLPRAAATLNADGVTYSYAEIVYNESDGYYHVGTANGPLLLVDLLAPTDFDKTSSIWEMAYNGKIVYEGVNYAGSRVDPDNSESPLVPSMNLTKYSNYASNSQLNGICPVNQELYELLKIVDKVQGFDPADDMEWMKACKYFAAYGTGGEQLVNPIAGISISSAFEAKLGKNVETNCFYYDRIIMPRGMYAKFVPSRSGVYRITSRTDSGNRVDGWIFDENSSILMTYEWDERLFTDGNNVSMVFYMEAGKSYYINIAFWDLYEVGYVYYDVEFLGSSYSFFRSCSPGPFTYIEGEGGAMLHTIARGIDVVLGDDGIYYHDLGGGKKGSPIYVDFTNATEIMRRPFIDTADMKGVISLGGFDFSKSDSDLYILSIMEQNDNDPDKTIAYLKEFWGESYEEYFALYQVEDVLNSKYHGSGHDMTNAIKAYLDDIITGRSEELNGCVVVTEELAELLQMLMDKYTFKGVDTSWRKLCYYYDYMGK